MPLLPVTFVLNMKSFTLIGSIGFAVNLLLNLVALLALHRPAAVFFSGQWYGDWFPLYLVWSIFLMAGPSCRGGKQASS